jgi:hypothetical protein
MDSATEATLLRQLIANNQNREAAERLHRWFEGKSADRYDAAIGLLNRITALNDNVLRGLIGPADANLENNRITHALLDLTKQLDETAPLKIANRTFATKWLLSATAVLIALALFWIFSRKNEQQADSSPLISVPLKPVPDTTLVRGVVYLPGTGNKPAQGARLDFNIGQAQAITDEKGQFKVPVPAAAGATVKLMIEYKEKNRYNRDITISKEIPLQITLNQ